MTVGEVKSQLVLAVDKDINMSPSNLKLILKGKVLIDDHQSFRDAMGSTKPAKQYNLVATGLSSGEQRENHLWEQDLLKNSPQIRDDLTDHGRQEMDRRRLLGRKLLQQAAEKDKNSANLTGSLQKYGFDSIETIPNLPDVAKAREILTTLANDPGIVSCMTKHRWKVGCLAELYPEGRVGESPVCVMGLNQNKGQKILLRIRTDDLQGFRKMLSIRKVLFHELAHNVHSDHNQEFNQLMHQIERECNDLDWTRGAGTTAFETEQSYKAGSYRLGGCTTNNNKPLRELVAMAALQRITEEEQDITSNCGCGLKSNFLPPSDDSRKS